MMVVKELLLLRLVAHRIPAGTVILESQTEEPETDGCNSEQRPLQFSILANLKGAPTANRAEKHGLWLWHWHLSMEKR